MDLHVGLPSPLSACCEATEVPSTVVRELRSPPDVLAELRWQSLDLYGDSHWVASDSHRSDQATNLNTLRVTCCRDWASYGLSRARKTSASLTSSVL